ncbi:LANO_0F10198g1_1 [Lachancea nothofagi CBS 11611]|uniref:LANO_0F10198g1_1 n=1 Tax=Lachancea nothofagi CBS 11611 TaxID=1266666 RepID=A0A1G4KAA0_9SACH|nr:LANO_0F10198g1_1 [Lachancea nothofagi CBS 11611]
MESVWKWAESCHVNDYSSCAKSAVDSVAKRVQNAEMTTMYTAAAIGAFVLLLALKPSSGSKKKSKKSNHSDKKKSASANGAKEKKRSSLEEQIEAVYQRYLGEYKSGLDHLIETFDSGSEKAQYQLSYFNEMLLKLLIELDGVDLVDVEAARKAALKDRRKQVIREIQTDLKRLDSMKN